MQWLTWSKLQILAMRFLQCQGCIIQGTMSLFQHLGT